MLIEIVLDGDSFRRRLSRAAAIKMTPTRDDHVGADPRGGRAWPPFIETKPPHYGEEQNLGRTPRRLVGGLVSLQQVA